MEKDDGRGRLTTGVAIIITVAWSVSFTLDIVVKNYDPPPSVTPLMLAVAGWLFGGEFVKRARGDGKTQEANER